MAIINRCNSLPCLPYINKVPVAVKITGLVLGLLAMVTAAGLYFSGVNGTATLASYYVGSGGAALVFLSFVALVVRKCKPQEVPQQRAMAPAPPYIPFELNAFDPSKELIADVFIKFADGSPMCTYHLYDSDMTVGRIHQLLANQGKGSFGFIGSGKILGSNDKISKLPSVNLYAVQI